MADLEEKKVVLTNTEVTKLKNELEDLRLNKRKEMLNMMLQKKSRAILKDVLKRSKKLLSMQRLLMKENLIILK